MESYLDSVYYNKEMLAFEKLCDYIANYDVCPCMEEYNEMIKLAADMGFDLDDTSFKNLKYLAGQKKMSKDKISHIKLRD